MAEEMLTLPKFEEASEIVKKSNTGDQTGLQQIFQRADGK